MLTARILKTLKERWTSLQLTPPRGVEPLDHPSLQAMSLRALADLPLEPPQAPGPDGGALVCNPGRAATGRIPARQALRGTVIGAR
ncbi:hypothetical protein J8I29_19975 [Labrys sp. LIt4]|uniref:hypothetical protein n=1 Tax=Labrys sp. LIt4 TaxID=2821355 RepID=UPI001ADEC181|nr:hypothetical protein [Labrys sp. LIt4]MBP0581616.1 hypothetical protein [Labrys sp. LIt4]